jgi:hypothetical protein
MVGSPQLSSESTIPRPGYRVKGRLLEWKLIPGSTRHYWCYSGPSGVSGCTATLFTTRTVGLRIGRRFSGYRTRRSAATRGASPACTRPDLPARRHVWCAILANRHHDCRMVRLEKTRGALIHCEAPSELVSRSRLPVCNGENRRRTCP